MSGAILETEALLEGSKNKNLEEQVSTSDGDEQVTDDDDDDDDDDRIIEINHIPVDPQSQIISSGISFNISSAPPTDCSSQRSSWSMVHRYREAFTKYFTSLHRYEVFLSFRGSDTRKAFTDHLYTALVRASIQTFRDECDLEKGENIKSELYKAIEESRIAIIVFSKEYASSEWCLDELVRILERKKTTGLKVLPVFYDVQPSQIRNHSRNLGKAFSKAEQMDKVQEWKTALKEVADMGGMVLQNESDGHESKFIQEVVAHVKSKLNGEASYRLTFKKLQHYISRTLLFPTFVRNSTVSMVRQTLVLGGVLSPVLVAAGRERGLIFSYGSFGITIEFCGVFVMFLPETRGHTLCDSMDEEEE